MYESSEREEEFLSLRTLPKELFGDAGCDINDFQIDNYTYFLDNVKSCEDLIRGLRQLSPLADDALLVAEDMSEREFHKFKHVLAKERRGEYSNAPKKFRVIMMPSLFTPAILLADKFQVPLGTALIKLIERESAKQQSPSSG